MECNSFALDYGNIFERLPQSLIYCCVSCEIVVVATRDCHPNGGVPQGTLSGPKCFLVYINDLRTTVPLYKYVDDSTLFEICDRNDVSVIQESVDIAARLTEQNDMKINSEKSKEIIIRFAQDGNFRSTIPNIKIDGRDIA